MSDDDDYYTRRIEQAKGDIINAIDNAIVMWKGAQEFRNAVEDLLKDTPYRKPDGYDREGLYGRLRAALESIRPMKRHFVYRDPDTGEVIKPQGE